MKTSISIRKDKADRNGLCPLRITITLNGQRVRQNLPVKCLPKDFTNTPQNWVKNQPEINALIQAYFSRLDRARINAVTMQMPLTVSDIQTALNNDGTADNKRDFVSFCEQAIDKFLAQGGSTETARMYRSVLKKFKTMAGVRIPFGRVSRQWFENEILPKYTAQYPNRNTLRNHLRVIQGWFNQAKENGIKFSSPMEFYKLPTPAKAQRDYLTTEQLQTLMDLHKAGTLPKSDQLVLGGFLFRVFAGGMRIGDFVHYNDKKSPHLSITLSRMRYKSQKKRRAANPWVDIPILPQMRAYANFNDGQPFFEFVYTNSNNFNLVLKRIAKAAKLDINLTTHVARHTFAMMYLRHGGQVQDLKEIMGHSDITITMRYVKADLESQRKGMENMAANFAA